MLGIYFKTHHILCRYNSKKQGFSLRYMLSQLMFSRRPSGERGFTLLASAVCIVALFGAAGLAVDIGRMYITKNEAQSYADAGAVAAALKLDGTAAGLTAADAAVAASPNK